MKAEPRPLSLPDYPYEVFSKVDEDGVIRCRIPNCHKSFVTYDEYLSHFLYNYKHFHYMKRTLDYYVENVDTSNEVIDPIERELINMNIQYDKDFLMLKYDKNVTPLLDEKIEFAVNENKMIVGYITGLQGAGKSFFGLTLANIILDKEEKKKKYRPRVFVGFERSDTIKFVKEAKAGDVIVQDEVPLAAGFGDKTEAKRLRNMLMVLRKAHIHFIFISPDKEKIPGLQFAVEVLSYTKDDRITKAVLYNKQFGALGFCYLEVLDDDDPQIIEYNKKKDEFVDKIQLSGGSDIDVINPEEFEEDVSFVLEIVKQKNPFMKRQLIEKEVALFVKQNTRYQGWVAAEVIERLKDEVIIKELEKGTGGIGANTLGWEQTETINDSGFGQLILNHSDPTTKHQKLGREWFKNYFCTDDAKSMQAKDFCNEEFDADYSKGAYYNIFFPAFIKDEASFGKAVEKAIKEKYFPNYEIDGSTGQPDLIGKEDFIEVKARHKNTTRKISDYFDGSSYIWSYLKEGKNVKLVEVVYAPKNDFVINIYDLKLIDNM